MPAINPARLRHQAYLLADHFGEPAAFVRSLHHLLDLYADRAHRPGRFGLPAPLLEAYNVRPPVLRRVLLEVIPRAQQDRTAGLALCDALWEQPYLEFRLLAAWLLGHLPADPPQPVLERVRAWLIPETSHKLIEAVVNQGLAEVRSATPQEIIQLASEMLQDSSSFRQELGLRVLNPLAGDMRFVNLPVFFQLIYPFVRRASPSLRPDLLALLATLARRSPQETAYFLHSNLEMPDAPDTAWLIRQTMRHFPPSVQDSLRQTMRAADNYPGRS